MASASASAAPDLSRVIALSIKAMDLKDRGHAARCAEKLEQVVTLVASQPGSEDCLILATLRNRLASALLGTAQPPDRKCPPNADALDERAFCTLLPAAMTALEARRTAGTLMPGGCRPAELAWRTALVRHSHMQLPLTPAQRKALVVRVTPFMGYEAYMGAASLALIALNDLRTGTRSAAHAQNSERMLAFVACALELVAQPRGSLDIGFTRESALVDQVSTLMRTGGDVFEDWRPLLAPWRRVQANGVQQQRHVGYVVAQTDVACAATRAAAEAAAAAPDLRACALPSCGAREAHVSHFKLCAACKTVAYCSKAHQAEDWARHKTDCKAARAAAAAATAAQEA
jgi:hypothetical protein